MTSITYSVLQLALSKQLASNQENLALTRENPYSETAVAFWEKCVEETKQANLEVRKIYEETFYERLVG